MSDKMKKITVALVGVLAAAYVFFGAPAGGAPYDVNAAEGTVTAGAAVSGTPTVTATPTGSVTPTPDPTGSVTPTPVPQLIAISALYNGGSKVIGTAIDRADLEVTAYYDDGSSSLLGDNDYTLSQAVVTAEGSNRIIVVYRAQTSTFYITGKRVESLLASTSRFILSVGNALDKRDLTVTVIYSDGSTENTDDYTIVNGTITAEGQQTVNIFYAGVTAQVSVYGTAQQNVVSLAASFELESVVAGATLDPLDFTVMAVYADGSTERVTNFALSRTSVDAEGTYDIRVTYRGASATVSIRCVARTAVSIRARYNNTEVVIGNEVDRGNIEVYVTFIDGVEEEVEDYEIYSPIIKYLEENTVRIHYGELQTEITVIGTQYLEPSFDYVAEFDVTNGTDTATVTAAIPTFLETDAFVGENIRSGNLKKIFRRLKVDGKYIGFTMEFTDIDDESELPMVIRIEIPDDYDMENTYLYYTPNLRTIVGRMNKAQISDSVFETTIFKTGTYMLIYSDDFSEDEEEEEDEEE